LPYYAVPENISKPTSRYTIKNYKGGRESPKAEYFEGRYGAKIGISR